MPEEGLFFLIGVLCQFDGTRALGKARELAESLGQRVVALTSESGKSPEFTTKLIRLGADEVISCVDASSVFDWSEIISELIKDENRGIDLILGVSGILTDAIFGRAYALSKASVGAFATGVDSLAADGLEASKYMRTWSVRMRIGGKTGRKRGKVAIFSLKAVSLPEPFEDETRYGKVGEFRLDRPRAKQTGSPSTSGISREDYLDSSSFFSILVGSDRHAIGEAPRAQDNLVDELAKKYGARIVHENQQEIYGNCLEIGPASGKMTPRIHGDALALVSSEHDVPASFASTTFVAEDVPALLRRLSQG